LGKLHSLLEVRKLVQGDEMLFNVARWSVAREHCHQVSHEMQRLMRQG
jgi:hypothetical protein